jgi:hypothetical protein
MHENEHWIWKLLSSGQPAFSPEGIRKPKGMLVESKPVVNTNNEHVEKFVRIVLREITKKAGLSYPVDSSLIVECSLNSLYTPDDWDLLYFCMTYNFRFYCTPPSSLVN